ncbi:MAG: AsnC family transcriptional regulator [Armatimonadota bacterium]
MAPRIDATDRRILEALQTEVPLDARPYAAAAEGLGITEGELLRRLRALRRRGLIRRIGATFEPRELGYVSTLVACRVPPAQVDEFASIVNRYPEVTHNYEREHEYNVWFAVIAPSEQRIAEILAEIRSESGVEACYTAPQERRYKIRVHLEVASE